MSRTVRSVEIFAVANQKGGVGKSATTLNLAAALAAYGDRVLIVDLDPQGHLSDAIGMPEAKEPATLCQAMLGKYPGPFKDLIRPYEPVKQIWVPGVEPAQEAPNFRLDVVAWSLDMFLLEPQLYTVQNREYRLAHLLEPLEDDYDVVVIDCPPSLGALTDNALVAARRRKGRRSGALIPVQAEDSSLRALRLFFGQVESLEQSMRIQVELLGQVVNLYDKRRGRIVTTALEALKSLPLPILALIEDRTVIREAWRAKQPVIEYDPDSAAAVWYTDLAQIIRSSR